MLNLEGIEICGDGAERRLADCQSFLDSITDTDEHDRLLGTLNHALDMLRNLGNAKLYYDFAPLSFLFGAGGFQGGLIFHGPTNGSAPNYCVSLDNRTGWQLHT